MCYNLCDLVLKKEKKMSRKNNEAAPKSLPKNITLKIEINPATIYVALKRLEKKKMVSSVTLSCPDGSLRIVRIYRLTDIGSQYLRHARAYWKSKKMKI